MTSRRALASSRRNLDVNLKLRLDTPTHKAVQKLARTGDRSVAQELRRAIRNHVNAETAKETS